MLKRLKEAVLGTTRYAPAKSLAQPLDHEVLGLLAPDSSQQHVLVGRISHGDMDLEVRISADDGTIEEAISLAAAVKLNLAALDTRARIIIADEFFDGYNSDWRFGHEVLADGSTESFEKPLLSKDDFCAKLRPTGFNATGSSCLTFWYDDDDMFWGHSLSVISFSGTNFDEAYASMSG